MSPRTIHAQYMHDATAELEESSASSTKRMLDPTDMRYGGSLLILKCCVACALASFHMEAEEEEQRKTRGGCGVNAGRRGGGEYGDGSTFK